MSDTENAVKTREIVVESRVKKMIGEGESQKPVWNISESDGIRFAVWDADVAKDMQEGATCKIRYYESKNGKFTNRTINAVQYPGPDGDYGDTWIEAKKSPMKGGKSWGAPRVDQDAVNTAACLQAAAILMQRQPLPEGGAYEAMAARTIGLARALKAGLFAPAAASATVASNGHKAAKPRAEETVEAASF